MKLTHFESEADFQKAVDQFSVLCGGFNHEWKTTHARTEHDDLFNVHIEPRELHFRKNLGSETYGSVARLSVASMEKVLYVVIGLNPSLGTRFQKILDREIQDLSDRVGSSLHKDEVEISPRK